MLSELHAFTKCDNACSSESTLSSVAQCFRAMHGAEHMISSVQRLGRRIKFRGHAKLCRAMVSNGAWYRELLLSFAYSFGTVR